MSGHCDPGEGAAHGGVAVGTLRLALVGSPNSGKTTLFNALTGLRAKTGNYPGVTVARYEGLVRVGEQIEGVTLVDVQGDTVRLQFGSETRRLKSGMSL